MPKSDTDITSDANDAPKGKRRRKSTEGRRRAIIQAAADHFAEVGFHGGTRDIAKRVGVTQPLLYRYFPDKDALIEAVYQSVYLESWNPDWDAGLGDRSKSVRARYDAFYAAYVQANFEPRWLRISYFAGLRDARINEWYNHLIEELILKKLVREHRVELGMGDFAYVSKAELEPAWQMHGGLLHYGWRRHVLNLPTADDTSQVIADALDMYFSIAKTIYIREAHKDFDNGHEGN